jgi:predicted nuclease of predicted toxin-antitoxin system
MKFLANENFPLKSIHYLEKRGFDIAAIGREFPGIQDHVVMQYAESQDRIILTFDRDYGELIFKHNFKPKNGVIYFRLEEFDPETPGKMLDELIINHSIDFSNTLTVLDHHGIRQRKYS